MLFPQPTPPQEPPRVVITGAGLLTALGLGWRANSDALRRATVPVRPVTQFDVSRQRVQVAAEVDLPSRLPATALASKHEARLERAGRMLLLAAHEAWSQAVWRGGEDLPLVLGTTSAGMTAGEAYFRQAVAAPRDGRQQPTRALQYLAHTHGRFLGEAFEFDGPITVVSTACASGANAVGFAWESLRRGLSDRVLVGAYDALNLMTFAGFDSLQVLSPTVCRPFDVQRDGLTLGEGAAVLALETLESAQNRDVEILGEIIGYGTSFDLFHLTQPDPEGAAALDAMRQACACAHLVPGDVQYINAHGTGTRLNDSSEAVAINHWAGDTPQPPAVSSTKAATGHLLGAAGGIELVISLMALREQWLPPEPRLDQVDPVCRFPVVREAAPAPLQVALSNSFGFGGANATLAVRRWS